MYQEMKLALAVLQVVENNLIHYQESIKKTRANNRFHENDFSQAPKKKCHLKQVKQRKDFTLMVFRHFLRTDLLCM